MAKRRLPTILTPAEREQLVNAARSAAEQARTPARQYATWRDFVMVQTGLLAGCRVSELCNLQVEQVDLVAAAIALKGCKGDKDRNLPIAEKLLTALKEWIGERRTGNLFPGPKGRRLAPRTFQLRLATLARQAGILKRVHPHIMRHTFATSLLRTGADIAEVQQLLGHSSLKTTAAYLHVDVGRLKSAVDRL